ncbi:nuclear pore complex protein Nup205 [Marchantia polymorpha subsp. ruderalis]|uniref:Nuclear pore complex protein Nup205 n=2 Tax=Marchantia polymorpha TaxID=3197 RepID=A0A176WBF7_MARPO|nr:hypothetical protein AXG93_977s1120 [Marchantia polymorpha subsp. ruderalis]PTQ38315.1 hypothetical protein MARPO_0052s0095 [Marchantia polymorpha]PTQ38316.1 hypothetical protein MARPO_0052s0095 [Marchantia polymorpha]BBN13132.1 hypothetical protein Mp_6g01090 [Marchantia polymorpha subsp. ruderalis]BBN13133.1 hypothetical protein Mp_6g01090 [Marchantia polymorpha subsp. ruderalis]|eukprot:PTQ38315.1 hypothetical protein MARPO_0052s0095 [Marchantia polymorpha]
MVSYRRLQATVEAALRAPKPEPHHRADLAHALHLCNEDLKNFLFYPGPKAEDRQQVLSKEVRLPNAPPTILDNQDAEIALKLSDDFHLNEVDCVSLLVAAHQEWNLLGREPLEVLRLSAGLWFTERRALITAMQLMLRAVVLDEDLDPDFVGEIRQFIEGLVEAGFRRRLISLIKEINREEPAGCGGPGTEPYVMDARGALVLRRNIAQKERLSISQCLVLSCLIVRLDAQEAKEIYSLLKDCSTEASIINDTVKLQVSYTIMFALAISLLSDALGGSQEVGSVLSFDPVFRREFQKQVMEVNNRGSNEGFTGVIRFVWSVFMMLTTGTSEEEAGTRACLDWACENNVFDFLTTTVLKTAAYQNDDEDLIFMYDVYLHKLITSFLSQSLGHGKVKELKEMAMIALDTYMHEAKDPLGDDVARAEQQALQAQAKPFISLLDFISEVYQREPELTLENDLLWNFVRFSGEDHTSHLTLVAFLNMLTSLASNEDTAKKVYQLLQNKTIRAVGWQTLFNSLNVYDQRFKQSLQITGALLPVFQVGDARALEAYLKVLKKVMEVGSEAERSQWFPDIEPLFKLLPYENVPPYLKGALRNAISVYVQVSPAMKEKVWRLLEQYDLPVLAAPIVAEGNIQQLPSQAYDMTFELNEVEARQEEYPSTLSYLELLNVLMANEVDNSDRGRRYSGIFRFVRDQVFGPFAQRAYADPVEKWKLVVAALTHFQMMLNMYQLSEDEIRSSTDHAGVIENGAGEEMITISRLPCAELMKDLMSGKVIFRNIMSILQLGVNTVSEERTSQLYGPLLDDSIRLCLQLLLTAFTKDTAFAEYWRPVYSPIDVVLLHDIRQIITLLEYVRYDLSPKIQQSSIQIMSILSARMPHLVSVILETGAGTSLIEDYAACLEARSLDMQAPDSPDDDTGSLILRLLIENLERPAPNITHLLLRFDVDRPVERTILQPKRHYSCLRIILDILDSLSKPEINGGLHELGFQLMYELCVDLVTSPAVVDLLRSEKYDFFTKHLDSFACEPLPSRTDNHSLRVSSLQQRAWLLKLLALELHVSDIDIVSHRDSCRRLLAHLFLQKPFAAEDEIMTSLLAIRHVPADGLHKIKVLELLDILQFPVVETRTEFPQELQSLKAELKVDEILDTFATVDDGGVYHISERGDRLIDLAAFRDALWQEYRQLEVQYTVLGNVPRQLELRDAIQKLLKWSWRRNKNLEEQAAQLHMLVGWTQLVEVAISRRFEFLSSRSQILFEILDACVTATLSTDCSLKMAFSLSQVVMTTMAKLQEQSMVSPGEGESTDDVTYLDLLSTVRLSNSACHTILSKLVASILRPESSEYLRRRQYATLLSYLHYCQGMVNRDLPLSVMRTLLLEDRDGEEDVEIEKLDRDQSELAHINFTILKREATALMDLVVMDATHGSEVGKAMAYYVLDALLGLDHQQVFLGQLQSRGLLQSCLTDISTNSYQAVLLPSLESVRRLYTLESEMALLLRVGYHSKKRGAQALFAMGALRHLSSCRALNVVFTEDAMSEKLMKIEMGLPSLHDRQHQIISPILRLVLCFTALVDSSASVEKGQDEVVQEILKFVKEHHSLIFHILGNEPRAAQLSDLEEIQLVTAILSKVWPCEDALDPAYTPALFSISQEYFCQDSDSRNRFVQHILESQRNPELSPAERESVRKMELLVARVRCNLISFVYTLVTRRGLQLSFSHPKASGGQYVVERQRHPTLKLIASLLHQTTLDLETALNEKAILLSKLQDVNELSRHEVDEVIKAYGEHDPTDGAESIRKRRYLAMVEMCSAAGSRECQMASHVFIIEQSLEILYIHFDNRSLWPQTSRGKYEMSDVDSIPGRREEIKSLCEKVLPVFEQLEKVDEKRVGRSMKHIERLVRTLKSQILVGFPSEFL